mgnify:FL=1
MGGLISRIGIEECFPGKYDDMIDSPRGFQLAALNVMLERRLQANYKTGYWEVVFSHTKPLGLVPEDMRAH